MDDQEIADALHAAEDALNDVIKTAAKHGLRVEITVHPSDRGPGFYPIIEIEILRPL